MTIQNWDSGGTWDSGLQWDVNNFPSNGDITPYLNLVTSAYANKPNFIAVLSAILQPIADNNYTLSIMNGSFDLDVAVGDQLDIVGQWVGITRYLRAPLSGVFFSFDTTGLGFDQGNWFGPGDASSGLIALGDNDYRTLLRAKIANNNWDGSIPGAYAIYDIIFKNENFDVIIQDYGDMTMAFGLTNGSPTAVQIELLTGGYLSTKPAGVEITGYFINSVPDTSIFGFDSAGPMIQGFDSGSWATQITPA